MNKTKIASIGTAIAIFGYLWAAPQFGAATEADIAAKQEAYFAAHGEYLQIIPGGKLPPGNTGTVRTKLGVKVPDDIRVDIFEAPNGKKGYTITKVPAATSTP